MRITKYNGGGKTNPSADASGEKGRRIDAVTMPRHAPNSHLLGLLMKKGTRDVRMTKTTKISVAIDSINHPV